MVCVLVVDDNWLMREHVKALLKAEAEWEVSEAQHGGEAIEKAKKLQPHLVILDFQMPVMNGLQAAPHILKHVPHVRIILFTLYAAGPLETAALAAGIHAVVGKDKAHTLLPTARSLLGPKGTDGHTARA